MRLAINLESGRNDLLETLSRVPPELAGARSPGKWSVLECVEHVMLAERRLQRWIEDAGSIPPRRDPDRELRLFTIIRSRLTPVEAPEAYLPSGRLRSLEEASAGFAAVRDVSIQMAKAHGEGLYSVASEHPYFGLLNGAELAQLIDGHSRRHAEQISCLIEVLSPDSPA